MGSHSGDSVKLELKKFVDDCLADLINIMEFKRDFSQSSGDWMSFIFDIIRDS